MPAVVAEGAEERLVDGAIHELGGQGVVVEHVGQGVGLAFNPKYRFLVNLILTANEEGGGLACVVDICPFVFVGRSPDRHAW